MFRIKRDVLIDLPYSGKQKNFRAVLALKNKNSVIHAAKLTIHVTGVKSSFDFSDKLVEELEDSFYQAKDADMKLYPRFPADWGIGSREKLYFCMKE